MDGLRELCEMDSKGRECVLLSEGRPPSHVMVVECGRGSIEKDCKVPLGGVKIFITLYLRKAKTMILG